MSLTITIGILKFLYGATGEVSPVNMGWCFPTSNR